MAIVFDAAGFGSKLRATRKQKGLTQVELARFSNCNARFIGELERGKGTIQMDKAFHVANMLGLNIDLVDR
jgi:transcriptional regulator with XRE-family HTH domain